MEHLRAVLVDHRSDSNIILRRKTGGFGQRNIRSYKKKSYHESSISGLWFTTFLTPNIDTRHQQPQGQIVKYC